MKKYLSSSLVILNSLAIVPVISCNQTSDYMSMSWTIDQQKVNSIKSDYTNFNSEAITIEKLKKVIKFRDESFIDRYTIDAINNGWFERVSFDVDASNQPTRLVIKLVSSKKISEKNKDCPYRLPNGSLEMIF